MVCAFGVFGSTVHVGGSFTSIGGVPRNSLAALDRATGVATAWDPNVQGGRFSTRVSALAVSGSTVYTGGDFTTVGGQPRNCIAALDAATGDATAWNPQLEGWNYSSVDALAVSGTTLYAGGAFTSIGGQPRNCIAALDTRTGTATFWNPDPHALGFPVLVSALAVSGATVYAGGRFTDIGGQSRNCIAALDVSTGSATAWNPNVGGGEYFDINALAVSGATVYAGGSFESIGGQARRNVAGLDTETGTVTAWNPGANAGVFALAISDLTVFAGGDFDNIGGQPRDHVAALDVATGFVTPWNPGADGRDWFRVQALAASGSMVYAGGDFTLVGDAWRPHFAAFGPALGPPNLRTVVDNLDGTSHMTWMNPYPAPAQFLGFAWDVYADYWVTQGWNGTPWFPYPPAASEGDIDLAYSGAYHVWISNQYPDGSWYPCSNPWTGIQLGGTPHAPMDVWVEDLGDRRVRLHWRPDHYGTWHWQIVVWQENGGFIPVAGPSGNAMWHFVDYGGALYAPGQADFFAGWADFTLPADGAYWLFLRAAGWRPPYDPPTTGDYGAAFVYIAGGQ